MCIDYGYAVGVILCFQRMVEQIKGYSTVIFYSNISMCIRTIMYIMGVDFWIFWIFNFLTTEFGLANEVEDQSRKGNFLYFHVFLCGNVFLWPKKRGKSHLI
jgi:hypothetical protein